MFLDSLLLITDRNMYRFGTIIQWPITTFYTTFSQRKMTSLVYQNMVILYIGIYTSLVHWINIYYLI